MRAGARLEICRAREKAPPLIGRTLHFEALSGQPNNGPHLCCLDSHVACVAQVAQKVSMSACGILRLCRFAEKAVVDRFNLPALDARLGTQPLHVVQRT